MKTRVFDSLSAITLLNDGCVATHPHKTLVEDIHQIHTSGGEVIWNHVLGEANQTADGLEKHGLALDIDFIIFEFSPSYSKCLSGGCIWNCVF